MIIDAFTFFNEKDILSIRLNELNEKVNFFILVEAEVTQSLLDKELFFEKNKHLYEKFLHKIIHVKIPKEKCLNFEPGTWQMENFQRNCIVEGLKQIKLKDDDLVMISDVDEIPNLNEINLDKISYPTSFEMSYHTFYTNLLTRNKRWVGTVISPYTYLTYKKPQVFRDKKDFFNKFMNSGWHLGYQGGKEVVYKKFQSCIEPFDKSGLQSFELFSQEFDRKIKSGGSFLFSDKIDDSIILDECKINYPNLPKYLVENKENFKHLFYNKNE